MKVFTVRGLRLLSIQAAAWFCLGTAQAAYPERVVTIIVPYPPGAAADAAMRIITKKLSSQWGQPVIIDNRSGVIGMKLGATAQPDGYTLTLGAGSSIVTAPLINPKLAYKPTDFAPVTMLTTSGNVLTVNPSLPVKTLPELIAYAKAHPGKLNYSSSGLGGPNHLGMELFQMITGTDMVHVPYRGAAPALTDLVGNQVQLGVNAIPSVLGYIKAGKLRPIAVALDKRSPYLPDVPTMDELGVKGVRMDVWYGLFAPSATPQPLIKQLNADFQKVLRDPQVMKNIAEQGGETAPTSVQELTLYIKNETDKWAKLIAERNLKLEE